ncbi:VWA domain-containing protein [Ramlibacter sp. AW1]|uniref:VWA domain-containing protein n=1 Tax=Ramlibacter aurantiacus TaxID=2801330 RepID=A0A936ZS59_9BURK|nr:vWA domain-containing protein [Ramlibacter aurantiacus]MBL0419639.1 VWA domain-containing protein [Ramlibacter aurantiacus]
MSSISAIVENDLYFVGADGTFRAPTPADLQFSSTTWRNPDTGATSTQTFDVQSVDCGTSAQTFPKGNYSAMMLFDRSGSMSSNDPGDLSLQAGQVFADAMTAADEAAVAAFPTSASNNRPSEFNIYTGFTADVGRIKSAVRSIGGPDGGTPLYSSIMSSLSYTSSQGGKANKAVLAFTDGQNNEGAATENDVISESKRLQIPVFPVGLKEGDNGALAQIAKETGGSFFFASEAQQLFAAYKSLAAILSGNASTCKVTVKTDLSGDAAQFVQGTGRTWTFTRAVRIDGTLVPFTFKQAFDVVNR